VGGVALGGHARHQRLTALLTDGALDPLHAPSLSRRPSWRAHTLYRKSPMPRVSIQQFRAALASRSEQGAAVRAYRALARRSRIAAETRFVDWVAWPPAAATA
jgi:hypothetical protein